MPVLFGTSHYTDLLTYLVWPISYTSLDVSNIYKLKKNIYTIDEGIKDMLLVKEYQVCVLAWYQAQYSGSLIPEFFFIESI